LSAGRVLSVIGGVDHRLGALGSAQADDADAKGRRDRDGHSDTKSNAFRPHDSSLLSHFLMVLSLAPSSSIDVFDCVAVATG
jgi:hypothetical protein